MASNFSVARTCLRTAFIEVKPLAAMIYSQMIPI